jgi:hypothetical protein
MDGAALPAAEAGASCAARVMAALFGLPRGAAPIDVLMVARKPAR